MLVSRMCWVGESWAVNHHAYHVNGGNVQEYSVPDLRLVKVLLQYTNHAEDKAGIKYS